MKATNYTSLDQARRSEPIVRLILMDRNGSMAECIIALCNDRQRMLKRLEELESIAPKKIRTPDGVMIWHCPDELVPITETDFKNVNISVPCRSARERELDALADEFVRESEAFDRTVCTGPIRNHGIMPANGAEGMRCADHAAALRRRFLIHARERGFSCNQWLSAERGAQDRFCRQGGWPNASGAAPVSAPIKSVPPLSPSDVAALLAFNSEIVRAAEEGR